MTVAEVRAALKKKLAESGLTLADAHQLKMEPYTKKRAEQTLPGLPAYFDGFKIPYFTPAGRVNGVYRFRYLNVTGFASSIRKPLRYALPKGAKNELYLPPLLDWREYAKEPSKPIVITEGELKAAAATKAEIPTIAIGGVDCFRREGRLLPAFLEFQWKNRRVYIAYDSDAATNPQVARAENRLCNELLQQGAVPFIVRLPALGPDRKTGLDDYLVAKGADALMELFKTSAIEYSKAAELFALNEEVVYVEKPGAILKLANNQVMAPRAFTDHAYSTRTYIDLRVSATGDTKRTEKSAAKEWLKWPHRAEVKKMVYRPGAERVSAAGELNLWREWGCEPKRGDTTPWHQLWEFLTRGEPDILPWIYDYWAYPLQHPGEKLYTCLTVWGTVHGTGKSLAGYTMGDIYGKGEDGNFIEVNSSQLFAEFNAHIACKQLVMGTEITTKGRRDAGDRLKTIITQESALIRPLYVNAYPLEDHCNYYFTSNHPDALYMEDSDRRNVIVEVQGGPLPDKFYRDYANWRTAGGAAYVFYELMLRDLANFNPKGCAPLTRAKQEMIALGRSDVADWVAELRDDPDSILRLGSNVIPGSLFSTNELYDRFVATRDGRQTTPNGLSRALKGAGLEKVNQGRQVESKAGRTTKVIYPRLWAIRNRETVSSLSMPELFKLYTEELAQRGRPKY